MDLYGKYRLVVRPLTGRLGIGRRRHAARLRPFLQGSLGVAGIGVHGTDTAAPQMQHHGARRDETAVKVNRRNQRLQGIAQQRLFPPPPRHHLGPAQLHHLAQAHFTRDICAGFLAHQRVETGRQLPLGRLQVGTQQRLGHHQAQHTVTQEFQPLIVWPCGRRQRRMGDCLNQQVRLTELVANTGLKRLKISREFH